MERERKARGGDGGWMVEVWSESRASRAAMAQAGVPKARLCQKRVRRGRRLNRSNGGSLPSRAVAGALQRLQASDDILH